MVVRSRWTLWGACVISAVVYAHASMATDYSVPCSAGGTGADVDSLNLSVNSAAIDASPSTVTLTAGCTYHLPMNSTGYFASTDASPSYFRRIDNSVTVFGNGATIEFDSGNSPPRRFFSISSIGSLTLEWLTLRGGIAAGAYGGDAQADGTPGAGGAYSGLGGAILNEGSLTTDGVTFDTNQAIGGNGGNSANDSSSGGGGAGMGGAIFSRGSLNIQRTTFVANTATGGANGFIYGCLDNRCLSAGGGGGGQGGAGGYSGIGAGAGSFGGAGGGALFGGTAGGTGGFGGGGGGGHFSGVAGEFGGRGAAAGFGGGGGAGLGGGIFVESVSGSPLIANTTFSGNSAVGGASSSEGGDAGSAAGGSVFLHNGTLTMNFDTIVAGSAQGGVVTSPAGSQNGGNADGGGIYVHAGATLNIAHVVVDAGSVAGGISANGSAGTAVGTDLFGSIASTGFNLVNSRGGSSGYVASDLADGTPTGLGSLQGNGGPTLTFLPQAGSALIDVDATVGCDSGLATDQRGMPRSFGTGCDIGAVESNDILFRNGFDFGPPYF